MTQTITIEPTPLKLKGRLIELINKSLSTTDLTERTAVTLNFRDPSYSAEHGGYHPVEIRFVKSRLGFKVSYITDFCYVGFGGYEELVKDMDFDFDCGIAQFANGQVLPIEEAMDIFHIWQDNFVFYATTIEPYICDITTEE
ncbi:DUF2787 family protein [Catenovulum adriaticum]|uniref:DUF2787 domain-containing protein n=1 Tax=Catenovulum adriaticum TaxID=2984846 RepID=A0ABY7AJV9_9ALTE|nr:DUF2787 family protein [Catenovulum sp. TS8]WAJ69542.1 DUF2787 domain-containing protein [Catenovulum sp. TS8]